MLSLLQNLRNHAKFWKILTKIGYNPVGIKVNSPKSEYLGHKYVNTQVAWK